LIRLGVDLSAVFPRLTALTGRGFLGTALAMIIDSRADQVRIARAGHPHPVLVPAGGEPTVIQTPHALPLGLVTEPMALTTVALHPGDMLIAFTDGLIERRNRPYDAGVEALFEIIRAELTQPVEMIADRILAELPGSDDDQALVIIRRRP
jgi:serine phosphatase RsbU (regulator of sigma subunit)